MASIKSFPLLIIFLCVMFSSCGIGSGSKGAQYYALATQAYEELDVEAALDWYEKAARKGHRVAQYELGKFYALGYEISQDYEKAVYWYEKSARQGYADAQHALAVCYLLGNGVSKDHGVSRMWEEEAAAQEHPEALMQMGTYYLKDYFDGDTVALSTAIAYFERSAGVGNIVAQTTLGDLYSRYLDMRDYEKAAEWYTVAVEADKVFSAIAQCELGYLYERGLGVEQDYEKAAELYAKAAERKYERALFRLGLLYEQGLGVPKDEEKAAELIAEAQAHGYVPTHP